MKNILAVFLLFIIAGCGTHVKKSASFYYAESLFKEAQEFYDTGQYHAASEKLDSILRMNEKDASYMAKAFYMKALVHRRIAKQLKNPINYDPVLGQFRNKRTGEYYQRLYSLAVFNVTTILTLFKEDEYAPKALLLLGHIYDYDDLMVFQEAMKAYKLVIIQYPDSKERVIAEKRLNELKEIFRNISESGHQ